MGTVKQRSGELWVLMQAHVRADVGATTPALQWAWIAVLTSAGVFLLLGLALVLLAVVRPSKPGPSALPTPPVPPVE